MRFFSMALVFCVLASTARAQTDDDSLLAASNPAQAPAAAEAPAQPAPTVDDYLSEPRSLQTFVESQGFSKGLLIWQLAGYIVISHNKSLYASALICKYQANIAQSKRDVARAKRVAKVSGASVVNRKELYEIGEHIVYDEEVIAEMKAAARKQRFALKPCQSALVAALVECWSFIACHPAVAAAAEIRDSWIISAVESKAQEEDVRTELNAQQVVAAEALAILITENVKSP